MASYSEDVKTFYRQFHRILFSKGNVNLKSAWKESFLAIFSKRILVGLLNFLVFNPLFTLFIALVYLTGPAIVGVGRIVRSLRRRPAK